MRIAAVLAGLGAVAMAAVLAHGFSLGDFASEGRQLLAMPWGRVSLVDLYVGFFLFAAWIVFREGCTLRSLLWIAAVMTLGSFAICVYVLYSLVRSNGHVLLFFLGSERGQPLEVKASEAGRAS